MYQTALHNAQDFQLNGVARYSCYIWGTIYGMHRRILMKLIPIITHYTRSTYITDDIFSVTGSKVKVTDISENALFRRTHADQRFAVEDHLVFFWSFTHLLKAICQTCPCAGIKSTVGLGYSGKGKDLKEGDGG